MSNRANARARDPGAAATSLAGGVVQHSTDVVDAKAAQDSFHPVANVWPLLGESELQELADDIQANGLRCPIWRHQDGRIIDGRNRWLACQSIGVECPANVFDRNDAELIPFIVSLNDRRRHLTVDQRAAIAAELAT